jgi:CBS domain-containing protein
MVLPDPFISEGSPATEELHGIPVDAKHFFYKGVGKRSPRLFHKVNAVLISDEDQRPLGVVSKTDLMAAFFAGLPIGTPLSDIMAGPPLTCFPDDKLESALELMRSRFLMGS